jgi:hypothetical protein
MQETSEDTTHGVTWACTDERANSWKVMKPLSIQKAMALGVEN